MWGSPFTSKLNCLQTNKCRLLRHLHDRRLGPGESVWLSTLSADLSLTETQLITYLDNLRLESHVFGRHTKSPSLTVPPLDVVSKLLAEHDVDPQLLEPMQGLVNGCWHKIKWLQRPSLCENGAVRFHATWKGTLPPSSVCCHELNASARVYVRIILSLLAFEMALLCVVRLNVNLA